MATPKRVPIPARGVDYRGKIVLAPMVRSGELPCRLLALHYGADLVWGPETIDQAMIGTTREENRRTGTIDFKRFPSQPKPGQKTESVIYRLHPEAEAGKLIFQLGTARPDRAVQAAKLVAADVAGIDVNSGCPKPFSTSGGMGAALLKDPDRLVSILEALVEEVGKPYEIGISVKIRLLATADETRSLVSRLVQTGITGLTVHCRTTPMRPRERAIRDQLRMIADICREAGVACVMNGDVASRAQALELIKEYGVDGAMLATAAESNPSVFRPEGLLPWLDVTREYLRFALRVENKWNNTRFSLAQVVNGRSQVGRQLQQAKNFTQAVACLEMQDELGPGAKEADTHMGIADRGNNPEAKTKLSDSPNQNQPAPAASEKKHTPEQGASNEPPVKKMRHADEPMLLPAALSV